MLTARFNHALAFAARLHAEQVRKGTSIPYLSHLLGVCSIALEHGATEDEAIGALLHDALEDAPEDLGPKCVARLIERDFGKSVLDIVEGCTDTRKNPKPEWRPRKQKYLSALASKPEPVLLVSASDKLHNARAILSDYLELGDLLWKRFTGGRDGTLWYYRSLTDAYLAADSPRLRRLAQELDGTVTEIERRAGTDEVNSAAQGAQA